ncbi:MAG: PRC-barrel domain-containing protein [Opitutaceae bacterium]
MLQNIKELLGAKLAAADGDIGKIEDFYFDDKSWAIRYLVADTGSWLSGRLVLLSPHAFGRFDQAAKILPVGLTRKQIEGSPSIETEKPVSRQYEVDYYRHYGWPAYWYGGGMWGFGGFPVVVMPPLKEEVDAAMRPDHEEDPHLRSAKAVTGYDIQATDGSLGSVTSFMVDDKSWAIGELVVEAGHWYSGKEILIPTKKITRISYEESKVFVSLTQADIRGTAEHEAVETGEPIARNFSR